MKKAIVIRKGEGGTYKDHKIRVKVDSDNSEGNCVFKVMRNDIPGLEGELFCEDTRNATLIVKHKSPTQTGWCPPGQIGCLGGGPCTSELLIHVHVHSKL